MIQRAYSFFLYLIIALCITRIPISIIYSADFQADYDVRYSVSPEGTTIVTQNVTLTNRQANMYPKQYSVTIDSDAIKNAIAYDSKGVITPKITKHDGKTDISVTFNDQVVGIDKKLPFTIRYENGEIAQKLGSIWEIHIPGISPDVTLGEYSVSLQTPSTFPSNAYMTPLPDNTMRWTKNQLINGGINAGYGEYQTYIVNITYNLENETDSPSYEEVSVPPDTDYQSIEIKSILPKPNEMTKDSDGNWIATFDLASKEKRTVSVELYVKTYIKPPKTAETIIDATTYTAAQKYWEVNDPKITKLSAMYTTPKAIYDYVVKSLSYYYGDVATPVRKGALGALSDPSGSLCTEFTDLFIAIARSAGIPAREMVGYAYTNDSRLRPLLVGSDILHAWPEYWSRDEKRWIPVDPTWGNTTGGVDYFHSFDFNHIAFVIHGSSSEKPYPAGSFKEGSVPQKYVSVRFADVLNTVSKNTYQTSFLIPSVVTSGSTLRGSVTVENTSGTKANMITAAVDAVPFAFHTVKTEKDIPPLGSISVPISLSIPYVLKKTTGVIMTSVNGEQSQFTFTILPPYWIVGISLVVLGSILLFLWVIFRKK